MSDTRHGHAEIIEEVQRAIVFSLHVNYFYGKLCFSPVYDPAPMRACSIHDALFPSGMGFGDYGDIVNDKFIDFETAMIRFSKNLGMNKTTSLNTIEPLLKVTDDYDKKINALETLPEDNKKNLIKIHQQIRKKLGSLLIYPTTLFNFKLDIDQ